MEIKKYIFIVLVYRNVTDLEECLSSIKQHIKSYAVVVVNSYYDEITKNKVKRVAEENDCEFINVENRGYGYGNNVGLKYALDHYDFEYAIISNPDIVIKKFDDFLLKPGFKYHIIAPRITAASGNNQNPMSVCNNIIANYLEYIGLKRNKRILFLAGIGVNKIIRTVFAKFNKLLKRNYYPIFAAHGSFVILSKKAVDVLFPVYDENVFMFAEEGMLACRAQKSGIKTCYYDNIRIMHKEDGSIKLSELSINDELKKSNIYFYEYYVKNAKDNC